MVQGIANQILSETPSSSPAPVTADTNETAGSQATGTEGTSVPDFDSRFGVLTKMERKIKEAEARNREMEKGWGEKEKKLAEMEEFMQLFEANPLEALKKKKGWGLQELNEFAVQHSDDDDLDPVAKIHKTHAEKMAELEKKLMSEMEAKIKAKEDEISAKDRDRQVVEFKGNLKSFLAENKDAYEFIHAEENGQEEVFNLIYEDVQRQIKQMEETGEQKEIQVMEFKDAADKVEAFLDKTYSKYLSLNKVKSKFQTGNEQLVSFITNKSKQEPTTLNSSFSPKSKPVDQLSAEERRQQAVAFVRQQRA